jgi:chromosome segregation protein
LRVGLKDRIEKLEHKSLSTEQSIENLEQELQATIRQYEQIDTVQMAHRVRESEQLLRKLESQQSSLSARKSVYEKNLAEVGERLKRLGTSVRDEQAALKELDPQIEALSRKAKELLGNQITRRNELEKIEENQDKARSLYNDIMLKHQAAENEVLNLGKDKERAEQSITSIKERLTQRSENAKQSKDRIIGYRSTIEELEVQLEEQQEEKGFIDALLREADKDCARQRGRIHQVEEDLKNRRRKREMTIELLHQLDMAKSQLDMRAKGIADHIWENYNILMENLTDGLPEDTDPDTTKERITSLKQKLKNIGEVNPLAIEEYEKEKERLDFYEQQINDLLVAENQLRETIREINETAEERFSGTFEQIRAKTIHWMHTLKLLPIPGVNGPARSHSCRPERRL